MDFSRLDRNRFILGALSGALLLLSLFLPWYEQSDSPQRDEQGAWLCGDGDLECTAFETFPILRWLLIGAAIAPLILGWIIVRGHKLSWAPGELTMVVGFAAFVLIAYNGLLDIPAPERGQEFETGLQYGYFVGLLAALGIAATGFLRSQAGQRRERKAPGTV